jgi:5-methylcytosine-specific restriction endonuclease McrA
VRSHRKTLHITERRAVAFDSRKSHNNAKRHQHQHYHAGKGTTRTDKFQRIQRANDGHLSQSHLDDDDLHPSSPSLSGKVLILNGNYEPLAICSVQKAIILLFLDKAEMVSNAENKMVHSVTRAIPFPSVIRLSSYVRVPFKKVILSRKNILRRDGHKCQYCGASSISLTVDHVIPKSRGGEDSWENLVSACIRCNNRKGSQTPDEAEMPLMKRPIRPNHVTFLRQYVGKVDKGWEPYLFMH